MNDNKIILIMGATGKQGRAVVQHVLQRGFKVRALTRNPQKLASQALKALGVEIIQGDMDDAASLCRAMSSVYGVFCTQNYWEQGVGYQGEIRQGRNVAEAASQAQVKHFVYSSVVGCDHARGIAHIESKWEVEKCIDSFRLPRSFIRSVFFMENLIDPKTGPFVIPVLAGALNPTLGLHLITVNDIGWFVAEAFDNPQKYLGQTVDIAGDCLTVAQMKHIYQKVTGKPPFNFKIPLWLFKMVYPAVAKQFLWNNENGWQLDIEHVRQAHPGLIGFESFLRTSGKW